MLVLINQQQKQVFNSGIKWDLALSERLDNPIYLESHGYKVYSQNDEDGIIAEIFNRIDTTNKIFIEFGVENGLECNSHYLLHKGWSGLWIEGSTESCEEIEIAFKSVVDNTRLKVVNAFITKDNINSLFENAGFTGEIDLLSIDIDGNDYHIWQAVNVVSPRAVIIEYNAKFPPDCEWIMPYKADYIYDSSDKQGASLKSYEILGKKMGYTLVGTNLNGVNAFFVRNDLVYDLFPAPSTSENLYNPLRLNYSWKSDHPPKYCLADDNNHVNEQPIAKKNIKIVAENIKSRKPLIWGMGMGLSPVKCALKSHNIDAPLYYDSKKNNYNSLAKESVVYDFSSITKDKYYVIISSLNYYGEIETALKEQGFKRNSDYIYFFY